MKREWDKVTKKKDYTQKHDLCLLFSGVKLYVNAFENFKM